MTSRRRERGFTLVELLVAITILGIISGAIVATATVLSRSTSLASGRLTQSRGPKLVGVDWTRDVNTSEVVDPAGVRCGTEGTELATFEWNDPTQSADIAQVVTWATVPSGTTTQLVRVRCSSDALTTLTARTVVAPEIAAPPTAVQCGIAAPAACASDSTPNGVVLTLGTADGRSFQIPATRKVG